MYISYLDHFSIKTHGDLGIRQDSAMASIFLRPEEKGPCVDLVSAIKITSELSQKVQKNINPYYPLVN